MAPLNEHPVLAETRRKLFLGDLVAVVDAVTSVAGTLEDFATEITLRVYYFLALHALGQDASVLEAITDEDPVEFLVLRALVRHQAAAAAGDTQEAESQAVFVTQVFAEQQNSGQLSPQTVFVGSLLFLGRGQYSEAVRHLGVVSPADPDCIALLALAYTRLSRNDLALIEVNKLNTLGVSTVAQVVESWANVASGTAEKARTTFYLFQELQAANQSSLLLAGSILTKLQLGEVAQAAAQLEQIISNSGPNVPADVLALAITAFSMGGNEEKADKARAMLLKVNPRHPLIAKLVEQEAAIDSIIAEYKTLM